MGMISFERETNSKAEEAVAACIGTTAALFSAGGWLLPAFGMLPLGQTLLLCLGAGIGVGFWLVRPGINRL